MQKQHAARRAVEEAARQAELDAFSARQAAERLAAEALKVSFCAVPVCFFRLCLIDKRCGIVGQGGSRGPVAAGKSIV